MEPEDTQHVKRQSGKEQGSLHKESEKQSVKSSHKSVRSRTSSTASDLYLRQKIKAETARKKLEFIDKERNLICEKAKVEADAIMQKASIDSELMRVKAEEDTVMAELSMKILEEEFQERSVADVSDHSDWTTAHTNRYVVNQSAHVENADRLLTPTTDLPPVLTPYDYVENKPVLSNMVTPPPATPPDYRLNPCAKLFVPEDCTARSNMNDQDTTMEFNRRAFLDVTNFLTKKSFILERVKVFSGDSESYLAWKSTFKEVMSEIDASPSVELDLMIHNLRGHPYDQVNSIKNSNTTDSVSAIRRAWERLDSYYGSPDRIAKALKRKLGNVIEKFDCKNRLEYFNLSDTLNEIDAVKDNPKYTTTLSYFDTSDGVNPVLLKLPRNFQNKWRDKAIRYKKDNDIVYPPFSVFCTFVQEMAYTMNDPGFDFDDVSHDKKSNRRDSANNYGSDKQNHRRTVTSNKTAVSETTEKCVVPSIIRLILLVTVRSFVQRVSPRGETF